MSLSSKYNNNLVYNLEHRKTFKKYFNRVNLRTLQTANLKQVFITKTEFTYLLKLVTSKPCWNTKCTCTEHNYKVNDRFN